MKTNIIAEIGINHDGKFKKAIKLIDLAKKAGADIVKFQIFEPDLMVTSYADKAAYQKKNIKDKEKQISMLKKYSLSYEEHLKLYNYCNKKKITYSASVFDLKSAKFLVGLKVKLIKIPSGEITNFPLIRYLSKCKNDLVLSTGMSYLKEVKECVNLLLKNGYSKKKLTILYCCSSYPAPAIDIDINIMKELKKKFKLKIGISDHSNFLESTMAAVSNGATIVEKHFTINRSSPGPDHKSSFDFNKFKQMTNSVNLINSLFKSGKKKIMKSEIENRKISRKSIVANQKILKGDIFTEKNLTTKRPGTGITPMKWEKIIGKKSKFNFNKDEQIKV